jgi:hypothetical protein
MTGDPGSLLHNSGGAPRTVVRYSGLAALRPGASDIRPREPAFFGEPLNAVLPTGFTAQSPTDILLFLGVKPLPDAAAQLTGLINLRANDLPLPDGCVVIPRVETARFVCEDPLTVLALLSKCSDSIWLRAKSPTLHAALARRQVTLLVPPLFTRRLREMAK